MLKRNNFSAGEKKVLMPHAYIMLMLHYAQCYIRI